MESDVLPVLDRLADVVTKLVDLHHVGGGRGVRVARRKDDRRADIQQLSIEDDFLDVDECGISVLALDGEERIDTEIQAHASIGMWMWRNCQNRNPAFME